MHNLHNLIFGLVVVYCIVECVQARTYKTYYMDEICDSLQYLYAGESSSIIIKATNSRTFERGLGNCNVRIITPSPTYGIIASMDKIDLSYSSSFGTYHCNDYLYISENSGSRSTNKICREKKVDFVVNPPVRDYDLTFYWDAGFRKPNFNIVLTLFKTGSCNSNHDFKCDAPWRCVFDGLKCDGENNCGDDSDEYCPTKVGAIVGGIIGGLIILGFGVGIFICLRRRRSTITTTTTHIINPPPMGPPPMIPGQPMYPPQPGPVYYPQGPPGYGTQQQASSHIHLAQPMAQDNFQAPYPMK